MSIETVDQNENIKIIKRKTPKINESNEEMATFFFSLFLIIMYRLPIVLMNAASEQRDVNRMKKIEAYLHFDFR